MRPFIFPPPPPDIMADALVRELNRLGYQPVFLPKTNIKPPELYEYLRESRRLVRWGELREHLPAIDELKPKRGELGDISYRYTSEKKLDASISFLQTALSCIGISSVPKIDLGFTGSKDFSFAFSKATYQSVDPSQLGKLLAQLSTDGIPESKIQEGVLHIAYEYAYADELLMSRADRKSFSADISGQVGAYIDVGAQGEVAMTSSSTISFKNKSGRPAAFAYKAGRLARENGQWVLHPETVSRSGLVEERKPFVPQPAIVLAVEDRR